VLELKPLHAVHGGKSYAWLPPVIGGIAADAVDGDAIVFQRRLVALQQSLGAEYEAGIGSSLVAQALQVFGNSNHFGI
jgi:hypothetical protein